MTIRTQFKAGFPYARAGAILSVLQQAGHDLGELDQFSAAEEPVEAPAAPRAKRMAAMDALNHRYGCDSVRLGSTAMATSGAETALWATKRERRSPRYTIVWSEMPTIGA